MSILSSNPLQGILTTDATWPIFFGHLEPEDWANLMAVDRCARTQVLRFREEDFCAQILTDRLTMARETDSLFPFFEKNLHRPLIFEKIIKVASDDDVRSLWDTSVANGSPLAGVVLQSERASLFEIATLEKALKNAVKENKPAVVEGIFASKKIEVKIGNLTLHSLFWAKHNQEDNSSMIELFLNSCHATEISRHILGHILAQHFENEGFRQKILDLCKTDHYPARTLEGVLSSISNRSKEKLFLVKKVLKFPEAKRISAFYLGNCLKSAIVDQNDEICQSILDFCKDNPSEMISNALSQSLAITFHPTQAQTYQRILIFSKNHGILAKVLGKTLSNSFFLNEDPVIQFVLTQCKTDDKLLKQVLCHSLLNIHFLHIPKLFRLTNKPLIWLCMIMTLLFQLAKIIIITILFVLVSLIAAGLLVFIEKLMKNYLNSSSSK